ncbi:hypothetical protein AWH48_02640 [Domibacillus aminovorans]|uniref:Uncharacterized protein n=2 Tax=Domibacillus aminovorans TaxID=29332 RepID=A0A177KX71_9BACI|nr:hypothetical protein [Bacillus sp. 37MA]OAH57923.1 hypothetical protein AWH48_02640 [Domibacillus aminovorans]
MSCSFGEPAGSRYGYGSKVLIVLFILFIIGGAFYAGRRYGRGGDCCESGYDPYGGYGGYGGYDPYSSYDSYGDDNPYGYGAYGRGRRGLII